MTKNPLSFLFAGFRYLLHCFSAGRLFDRCRFGRLSRRIFWETAAADAVVLLLTFFVPLEIAYRLQLEPESLFLRVWLCTWLILFAVLSVCLFRAARRRLHDSRYERNTVAAHFCTGCRLAAYGVFSCGAVGRIQPLGPNIKNRGSDRAFPRFIFF